MAYQVEHDQDQKRFYVTLEGADAQLRYVIRGDVLDIMHVFVPPTHRGGGLASQVTKAAFEYAVENGYRVQPTCPYVSSAFVPRHPEYQDVVVG